ncbi:hypothetical protein VNI00_016468 [Paramarasmius palmivorus]|uniref:F-box domain-containing protein n=1 Tax=Paramarasmius palmivorus TaxID=297713 RepID=A0AAW0BGN7_9AGAR
MAQNSLAPAKEDVDDVAKLLLNNNPPTGSQANSILNALPLLSNQLEETERTIHLQDRSMARLKEHRDAITLKISCYQRLLHPIRAIPDDVLRNIFQCYADEIVVETPLAFRDSLDPDHDTVWKLAQVSYLWREVALSSPSIWSDVAIRLPSTLRCGLTFERMRNRLTIHLMRAKTGPLTISLHAECKHRFAIPFIATIASHSERIVDLRLMPKRDNLSFIESMSAMTTGLLPALKRLTINLGTSARQLYPCVTGFSIAPRLCDITVVGDTSNLSFIIELPWDQIVRFRSYFDCAFAVTENPYLFLPEMTNLQELYTRRVVSYDMSDDRNTSIPFTTLHHLRKLCLQTGNGGAPAANALLGRIDLPNIQELELHVLALTDALRGFLSRHSSTIVSFLVKPLGYSMDTCTATIIGCIALLPGLRTFAAHSVSQAVINALSELESNTKMPTLIPDLRYLKLCTGLKLGDGERLVQMVKARSGTLQCIVLHADVVPTLGGAIVDQLRELMAQGLLFEDLRDCLPSSLVGLVDVEAYE